MSRWAGALALAFVAVPIAATASSGSSVHETANLHVESVTMVDQLQNGSFITPAAHVLRVPNGESVRNGVFSVQANQSRLVVYENPYVRDQAGIVPAVHSYGPGPRVVAEWWFDDMNATIDLGTRDALLLTMGIQAGEFSGLENLELGVPIENPIIADGNAYVRVPSTADPVRVKLAGWQQATYATLVRGVMLDGGQLVGHNATMDVIHRNGTTRIEPQGTFPGQPLIGSKVWWELVGDLQLRYSFETSGPVENTFYNAGVSGSRAGSIAVPLGSGSFNLGNLTHEVRRGTAYLVGNFSLTSDFAESATPNQYRLSVSGPLDFAYIEGSEFWKAPVVSAAPLAILAFALFLFRDIFARLAGLGVVGYTKLRKPHLLDHDRRQSLYDAIQGEPGVTFLQLHQKLKEQFGRAGGFGFGALTYHLSQLERFGLIVSRREGRFRRYFENGGKFGRDTKRIAILQTPPVPSVVQIVLAEPGASQTRIHEHVAQTHQVTRQAVGYHLKRLQKQELLEVQRAGKANAYFPTPKLDELAEYAEAKTASLRELQAERAASG